jgi:hypothetical protein
MAGSSLAPGKPITRKALTGGTSITPTHHCCTKRGSINPLLRERSGHAAEGVTDQQPYVVDHGAVSLRHVGCEERENLCRLCRGEA